jgi:antitoxin ParD1/3/4
MENEMAKKETITLSADTAQRIRTSIDAGDYASVDDLIRAALDALAGEAAGRADDLAWVKARIRGSVEDKRPGHSSEEVRRHLDDLLAQAEGRRHDSAA